MNIFKNLLSRKKDNIYDTMAQAFDYDFYRTSNPDLGDIDLLQHYIDSGWKDGRDPAPYFSTSFYIDAYEDVRNKNINPFYHYIAHGKKEGRTIQKSGLAETSNDSGQHDNSPAPEMPYIPYIDLNSHEYVTIKSALDAEYYANKYPDSLESGLDPVVHYMSTGWQLGYNPTPDFSTSYYLDNNRDIREAGINPFYHYVVRGKSENRLPVKPGGIKAEILYNLVPLDVRTASYIYTRNFHILNLQSLEQAVTPLLIPDSDTFVISIGHDNYMKNTGGVQLIQGVEQDACNRDAINYFHLSPAQPLPVLSGSVVEDFVYTLVCNGIEAGKCRHEDLCALLENLTATIATPRIYLVIHALHGHSVYCINDLHDKLPVRESYFWTHDYYSVCTGFNLLRNDITFCNAPEPDSNSCSLCIYGEERKRHLSLLGTLFEHISFSVISPSIVSRTIWQSRFRFPYKKHILNPYCDIHFSGLRISSALPLDSKQTAATLNRIKVAFIGHPVSHKGWQVFSELYEKIISDNRYDVHHLGQVQTYKLRNPTRSVFVSRENRTAMTDAIRENEIDLAFIWSIWPETFCIAAYEAMAAGALIVTTRESGNVHVIADSFDSGYVFENESELIAAFMNQGEDSLYKDVLARKQKGIPTGSVIHSNMTYELIKSEQESSR